MNGYERYMGVIKGNKVDYLPRIPILMQYAAEFIGANYGKFASNYNVLVESNIKCAEHFGIDQLSCISDPYRETHGFGSKVEFIKDGVPRSTHPLKETKDLSVLMKPDSLKSERMLDRIKAAENYKQKYGGQYSILGWIEGPAAEAGDLRGITEFLMDLMEDVDFVCELMDVCVDAGIEFARAQINAGVDTIGIGDAIASQIGPDTYGRLIQPREKKLVKAIQEAGAIVKLHICGNITHLLPGIADLGVDILDVDHMVNMKTVRDTVGNNVVITGNLDPVAVIRFGTTEKIKNMISEIYEQVGNPYMINAGCEIPSGTPEANLKMLCGLVSYMQ